MAIDTDHEYFQLFGSVHGAARYAFDLLFASSAIYEADISAELRLRYLRLWTSPSDPWDQNGVQCQLRQFGSHWNTHLNGNVFYSASMMLSARSLGGGLAWVNALCRVPFSVSAPAGGCNGGFSGAGMHGGPYGLVANMDGPQGGNGMTWDVHTFAHELGHVVRSEHTHCYGGIGGSSSPVDTCYGSEQGTGCYSGAPQLPGPPGAGTGTIMSYCHLRDGNASNIAFSLGRNHAWGVLPNRVPDRMSSQLSLIHAQAPHCVTTAVENRVVLTVEKEGMADTLIRHPGDLAPPWSIHCGDTCISVRPYSTGAGFLVERAPSPDFMVRRADQCPWREACGFYSDGECTPDDFPPVQGQQQVTVHVGPAASIALSSNSVPGDPLLGLRVDMISSDSASRPERCDWHHTSPGLYPLLSGTSGVFKVPAGASVRIGSNPSSIYVPDTHFLRWEGACASQTPPLTINRPAVMCDIAPVQSTEVRAVYGQAYGVQVTDKPGMGHVEPAPPERTPGSDTLIATWRYLCNVLAVVDSPMTSRPRPSPWPSQSGPPRPLGNWTCRPRRWPTGWAHPGPDNR